MLTVIKTPSISSLASTIPTILSGLSMSLPISYASGSGVPSDAPYPTPYYLSSMPLIPPFSSLEQSIVDQPMITSQPSMFSVQFGIGPNPISNLGSGFSTSFRTLVESMVMSSTCYSFGWNWNSGVSTQIVNMIGNVPLSSGLPYSR